MFTKRMNFIHEMANNTIYFFLTYIKNAFSLNQQMVGKRKLVEYFFL